MKKNLKQFTQKYMHIKLTIKLHDANFPKNTLTRINK